MGDAMSWTPEVHFENAASARGLTDQKIEERLSQGAAVSNTALSIHQARRRPGFGARAPYTRLKLARGAQAVHGFTPLSTATVISDTALEMSDESAIAINPKNPLNIVAGAISLDVRGHTISTAYVTKDGGLTWSTETVLTDVNEGAGIAFDDSGNCYYTTLRSTPMTDWNPVCMVRQNGCKSWSDPADFGYGDKTAVAARGSVALVGFDRLMSDPTPDNTEACAFTLDGGKTWTVHDFADKGLGTAPLVSYDQQDFYIIYGALDNNLKMYASHNQGTTWTDPLTIVANEYEHRFAILDPYPLSYQQSVLTCPGTNVAIDGLGTLHVLYTDAKQLLTMYTSSSDQGKKWSTPENVDPGRVDQVHTYPCLSCTKAGDLQGASLVYDGYGGRFRVLQHEKLKGEHGWTTFETDSSPWKAGTMTPGYRIGFGDYFDCDSLPGGGMLAMAWSESSHGSNLWQTWGRIGRCERLEDQVESLSDEIDVLEEAFEAHEIPIPRTPQNVARLEAYIRKLRASLEGAQAALDACRSG